MTDELAMLGNGGGGRLFLVSLLGPGVRDSGRFGRGGGGGLKEVGGDRGWLLDEEGVSRVRVRDGTISSSKPNTPLRTSMASSINSLPLYYK